MPLSQAELDRLADLTSDETKGAFADEIAKRTSLSQKDVMKLVKSEEDRAAMLGLLEVVSDATKSNAQKAQALRNVAGGIEAAVKIVGLFVW